MFIQLFSLVFIAYSALTRANIVNGQLALCIEIAFAILISLPLFTQMILVCIQASRSEMGYFKLFSNKALTAFCGEYSDFILHSISEKKDIGFINHLNWAIADAKDKNTRRGYIYHALTAPLVGLLTCLNWLVYCDPFSRKLRYESRLGIIMSQPLDFGLLSFKMGKTRSALRKDYFENGAMAGAYNVVEENYIRFCIGTVTIYYEKMKKKRQFKLTKLNGIDATYYKCSGNIMYRKKVIYCLKMLEKGHCFVNDINMNNERSLVHCGRIEEMLKACRRDLFGYFINNAHIGGKTYELDDISYKKLLKHNESFWGTVDLMKLETALSKSYYRKKPDGVGNTIWKIYISDVSRFISSYGIGYFKNFTLMEESNHYHILRAPPKEIRTPLIKCDNEIIKFAETLNVVDGLKKKLPEPKEIISEEVEEVRFDLESIPATEISNDDFDAAFKGFDFIKVIDGKVTGLNRRKEPKVMSKMQKRIAETMFIYNNVKDFEGYEEASDSSNVELVEELVEKNMHLKKYVYNARMKWGRFEVPYWGNSIASTVNNTVNENKMLASKIILKGVTPEEKVVVKNKFVKVKHKRPNENYQEEKKEKRLSDECMNLKLGNRYTMFGEKDPEPTPDLVKTCIEYTLKVKPPKLKRLTNPVISEFEIKKSIKKKNEYLGISNVVRDLACVATVIKKKVLTTDSKTAHISLRELTKVKNKLGITNRVLWASLKEMLSMVGIEAYFNNEIKYTGRDLKDTVPINHTNVKINKGGYSASSCKSGNHTSYYNKKYKG